MDNLKFEGDINEIPLPIEWFGEFNTRLKYMYSYLKTIDIPELRYNLQFILARASESLCNACYESNIDPQILDYWIPGQSLIITSFEPEITE